MYDDDDDNNNNDDDGDDYDDDDDHSLSKKGKGRKVQGFNVQFKNGLNQLSLSHESNKKMKGEKQSKTDEQLSPEMVINP